MTHARLIFSGILCAGLFVTEGVASVALKVAGTDLLGAGFSKSLYECAGRHELALALALDGSRPGIDQLKTGQAHLAIFVLPREEDAGLTAFECVPIAYQRVVVLVPPAAPLAQVSLDQLGGVFGVVGPSGCARWGELGVDGDWSGSPIAPHAPVAGAGIAAEFFRHAVLHGGNFKSNVGRDDSQTDLGVLFAAGSRVIALAAAPPPQPGAARIVPVALRMGDPAYLPTPENLQSGDYPLRLPVCIAFRRESAGALRPLLHFLFSDELALVLESSGLVPLPAAARRQQAAALDKL